MLSNTLHTIHYVYISYLHSLKQLHKARETTLEIASDLTLKYWKDWAKKPDNKYY